jgi:hypothetical protein
MGFFILSPTRRCEHPLPHLGLAVGEQIEPKKCLLIGKSCGLYALPRFHMDTSEHLRARSAS